MAGICRRIIVVGGYRFAELHSLVENVGGAECIENPSYQKGMFTSVKRGLSCVQGERCFVLPVDIPFVPPRVYERLLSVEADVAIPSFGGKNGHPVCCSRAILGRILREPDGSSFRDVLREIGFRTVPVDAEEILVDIDTPEDREEVQKRFA
jgi:molybdenum cofactor cytidylyltransferase